MKVYLDYNATAMPLRCALEKFNETVLVCGNPSSTHGAGQKARSYLETSRRLVAGVLRSSPEEIVFTSGGTESNNTVFEMVRNYYSSDEPNHFMISAIEHPSVIEPAKRLKSIGWELDLIPVASDGIILIDELEKKINPHTRLVSVQWANHETGMIQPIKSISQLCKKRNILFHTDAVQAAGKINIDLQKIRVDFLSISGHKFGGLTGAGVLYIKNPFRAQGLILGGGQEWNKRAGTENTPGICAMASALEWSYQHHEELFQKYRGWGTIVLDALSQLGVELNGEAGKRIPATLNLSLTGVIGQELVMAMDAEGVQISSGAACSSGRVEPSPVLRSMGQTDGEALSAVRVSMGHATTDGDIEKFIYIFKKVFDRFMVTTHS